MFGRINRVLLLKVSTTANSVVRSFTTLFLFFDCAFFFVTQKERKKELRFQTCAGEESFFLLTWRIKSFQSYVLLV